MHGEEALLKNKCPVSLTGCNLSLIHISLLKLNAFCLKFVVLTFNINRDNKQQTRRLSHCFILSVKKIDLRP